VSATLLEPVRLARTDAHEGPVYVPDEDALLFTTVRRGTHVAVKRLDLRSGRVTGVVDDANVANGMTLDLDGGLLVCEQGTFERAARISRLDLRTGERETVVDEWEGRPLNSPNDVVVARDGAIWFTDPSYGFLQGFRPRPLAGDHVYRIDPARGVAELVADGFDKPNGLAFAPDERTLYVGDNGAPHRLLAFEVVGAGLAHRRVLAIGDRGHPDGVKVAADGRIYLSARDGVDVVAPDGEPLERIELPGAVNFAFAGDRLLVTTDAAVWAVPLSTKGL
jgi:gluconolactonase